MLVCCGERCCCLCFFDLPISFLLEARFRDGEVECAFCRVKQSATIQKKGA
jgi:hypothetical protein